MSSGNPDQIRQDIEATREELGETVEALAAKTDVAGQAKRKLHETQTRIRQAAPESAVAAAEQTARGARQKPALLVVGVLVVGLLLLRRRNGR